MLQTNPNASVLTVSPPDSGFSPRREFVRESHVASSFALLSVAGASSVRLTSFRREVVKALRMYFMSRGLLRTLKEDKALCVFEFVLQNRPWANSKNVESEKLLIDILTIIYLDGYTFVSTIDYGRESDERTSMAYSRPALSGNSPSLDAISHPHLVRLPFAISFPSSTVLRVINPPRTTTPAILTGVRDAWPRGVVDERKFAGECFEFKLRGYKWFQEDTFSTDSLRHIFALLGSLDESSSTLVTSISLSASRSRVKDLWIFIGPPQGLPEILTSGSADLVRILLPSEGPSSINNSAETLHWRGDSAPVNTLPSGPHARSATEPGTLSPQSSRAVLHKKTSRGSQGPTSPTSSHGNLPIGRVSMDDSRLSGQRSNVYASDSPDMTGIGSGRLRNSASRSLGDLSRGLHEQGYDEASLPRSPIDEPIIRGPKIFAANEASFQNRVKTGELFYETGPAVQPQQGVSQQGIDALSSPDSGHSSKQLTPRDVSPSPSDVPQSVYEPVVVSDRSSSSFPRIMGSNVFRDSAFSSSTGHSYEIPIKWTGPDNDRWRERVTAIPGLSEERTTPSPENEGAHHSPEGSSDKARRMPQRHSTSFNVPGGWQPSPIEERPEDQGGLGSPRAAREIEAQKEALPETKKVDAVRVASPTFADTPGASRRSEAAQHGMISSPDRSRSPRPRPAHRRQSSGLVPSSPSSPSLATGTGGWVLVSFADSSPERPSSGSTGEGTSSTGAPSSARRRSVFGKKPASQVPEQKASLHPVAKMIAAADALSPITSEEKHSSSAVKKFFSSSKSKTLKVAVDNQTTKSKDEEREMVQTVRRMSLRDRWRHRG